ncbi:MAG: lipoprotein insertase outer membrane protein LolB [Acidiferrobacteraceae bacterium]
MEARAQAGSGKRAAETHHAEVHALRRLLALGLILGLSGCATLTRPPGARVDWRARQRVLRALTQWSANGQFAIRSRGHGGQAFWRWTRDGDHQKLTVLGLFGRVLFVVRERHGADTLQDAHGRIFTATSSGRLIYRVTGWRMPAGDLSYWIVGAARPGVPQRHTADRRGRLTMLEQAGWIIRFRGYDRYGSVALPRRLTLAYQGNRPRSEVHLLLVVHRWHLP